MSKLNLKKIINEVFNEYEENCTDPLATYDDLRIHQKYLQFLVTEVLKSTNNLNPQFIESHGTPCNLRCESIVNMPGIYTTRYGMISQNFRGVMLWNISTKTNKTFKILPEFRKKLKKQFISCSCVACHF